MPASSRLRDLLGYSSQVRSNRALLPGQSGLDGWPYALINGLTGGYLTAAADSARARTRVDLYWPEVRSANIYRIHADGTQHLVRGGDPATMCTGWARWDNECPLDQPVTYMAVSDERDGAVSVTGEVTVDSGGRSWLKSVAKPYLNLQVVIRTRPVRQQTARRGRLDPPLRADPIFVYQVRAKDKGTVALYAADQATETAIRAMLADGGPLLLQEPGSAGGESSYLMIDAVDYNPVTRITVDLQREIVLPFDGINRPPGAADGDVDSTYALAADAYQTYNQLAVPYATYLDLSMASF